MAQPFRLYNTLTRTVEPFEPREAGKIGIYVCGMTVYDRCHVGHARAMVVFDAFTRYLRSRGWDVRFVRNFTDVDDKIIRRASETGEEPLALAQRYIDAFHEDMENLGLAMPDAEPRVSECIEDIQAMIGRLVAHGHAYVAEGSVWFDVASFEGYGKLSGQKVDELRSADADAGKRSGADFALWKAAKPGEPEWESPWGAGRPGWHIECSAMAYSELGETFDIHGGGLDLVFPHHENEIAQSECGNQAHYSRWWMHNGLLTMASGQKMGKSLGNVINIDVALSEFPAEVLRLYYLQNHYRSPLPWSAEALPEALGMLSRLYEARDTAEEMGGSEPVEQLVSQLGKDAARVHELGSAFTERWHAAMCEDFSTGQAMGFLFELARAINRFGNHKKARKRGGPVVAPALKAFQLAAQSVGLMAMPTKDFLEEVKAKRLKSMGISRADVEARLARRQQHRADKEWAASDAIRDELDAMGIVVMDGAAGVEWKVKVSGGDTGDAAQN